MVYGYAPFVSKLLVWCIGVLHFLVDHQNDYRYAPFAAKLLQWFINISPLLTDSEPNTDISLNYIIRIIKEEYTFEAEQNMGRALSILPKHYCPSDV